MAMTDLVDAYQRREVHTAEKILRGTVFQCFKLLYNLTLSKDNPTIMGDPFIQSYIGDLLRSLRTSYLIDLIKPYTRLELTFLARVGYHFSIGHYGTPNYLFSNSMSVRMRSRVC